MESKRIKYISDVTEGETKLANKIMSGDHEGYDGADGARTVLRLTSYIFELIEEVEITDL